MEFEHVSVLGREAIEALNIKEGGTYVDGTMGGGGHSKAILKSLNKSGKLICFDQDEEAIKNAQHLTAEHENLTIIKSNFRKMDSELERLGVEKVDGILLDIGVSSPQLDHPDRGFSYNHEAKLDMRMDQSEMLTAEIIVNEWSENDIASIIKNYGEERFSKRIANKIVNKREKKPIKTTLELVDIIKEAIPAANRRTGPHPAKRTFQALRIAVNDELGALQETVDKALKLLSSEGRLAIITFHSLEDKIVKQAFRDKVTTCTCPPAFPQCVCGYSKEYILVNSKAIIPSDEEILENPRARSAKLRVIEKC